MKRVARLLREPLLHFVGIGGLIFLLFGAVGPSNTAPPDRIVVETHRIEQLASAFQAVWRRPPTDDELQAMIDEFVREEIYYREALALGLDRDDTVVRRRLRQKMEFLTDTAADVLEPAAGELDAYFAANEQAYERGPQLAFEQIYLGAAPAPERVASSLRELRSDPAADPSALGQSTLLPGRVDLSLPRAIDGVFGQGFFGRLADLTPGSWAGPVESAYGVHLVRVLDSRPARTPPLEQVRGAVLRDWKAAKAQEIRELHYAQLRERYEIEIRDAEIRAAENP